MYKELNDCIEFKAGDNTLLREILHPDKQDIKISYSLAYGYLSPGKTSLPHKLRSSEVYYILEGEGDFYLNDIPQHIKQGTTVYVPPNTKQYLKNTGKTDLKFLCIVSPPWKIEDEEIL